MTHLTESLPAATPFVAFAVLASTLVARWLEMRRVERDIAYLQGADARMLHDLGLDRSGVEHAVRFGRGR